MTILLGNQYLGWIESAVAGTYTALKGQGTLTESRSQAKIDTSDKTSGGYATGAYGAVTLTQSIDIKVNLPDAGYTRLETLALAQTPFNWQVRKNGLAGITPGDAVFQALVYGTITSRTFNKDGTVDAKIELALAAAPTVDTLA
uniref:phage tail tube protein n=1 Tax=uncultured Sphingomonas sp. TaxID=158754 RepID=UPI0035C96709